jgi:hypothetical protein
MENVMAEVLVLRSLKLWALHFWTDDRSMIILVIFWRNAVVLFANIRYFKHWEFVGYVLRGMKL